MKALSDAPLCASDDGGFIRPPQTNVVVGEDVDEFMKSLGVDPDQTPQREEEPEQFNPHPLKSRRTERKRLGKPGPRSGCFGCVYFGEKDTTIPLDSVQVLLEMMRQSIGRIDLVTLAEGMADYYRIHVQNKINTNLQVGERPLPNWSAAQILDCIRNHNQDPLIQQVVILAECQEMRNKMLDCVLEKSSKTGKIRVNKQNLDGYERITKLQLQVQKMDASKMAFYSASGGKLNAEILKQGAFSFHGKTVLDLWK